jgi:serine phosphatase RsbU (regulator of sigma subunit)
MGRLARLVLGGWGRRAAWTMLAFFLLLQVFVPALFAAPRLNLFDAYQRLMGRDRHTDAVVIVAIDDASLARIGQWPWPRQVQAKLVSAITGAGPVALGIDLLWPEPDQQSPEQWLKHAGGLSAPLIAELRQLPSHDAALARALASGPIAIGIGIPPSDGATDTGKLVPFRQIGQSPGQDLAALLPSFEKTLRSIPALDDAAAGHGVASVIADADGTFRRMPLVSLISGRLAPGLGLETLRMAIRNPPAGLVELRFAGGQVATVSLGALDIPTQGDGSVWVNFSPHDERRFVSAYKVLEGKVPPSAFDHAIVLLGETGLGRVDQRMTPVGLMPGVEIHAQLLENVLEASLASRPGWTRAAEFGLTLVLALLLIMLLPLLKPRWQIMLGAVVFAGLAGLGFGLWHQSHILLDTATPAIGLALVAIADMGGGFAQADMQRRRLRQELEQRKLAAARTEGELEAARRIQMGILPDPNALEGDARFELDALMIPARQIGGDLFDFFKMDEDHLFFSVGDVSGKGVPAALFMALGKSLCKSIALSGERDIGAIIDRTSSEISRENPEMLFITMFAGILDLTTGDLRFCSAGHDAPFLLRAGEQPQAVDAQGGPPLSIMEDFSYPTEQFQLKPGDLLCIITDGITEAMTREGAVMGRARACEVLAALPAGLPASAVIKALHDAVHAYVAGAEPSDDLTILTVRWRGATAQ